MMESCLIKSELQGTSPGSVDLFCLLAFAGFLKLLCKKLNTWLMARIIALQKLILEKVNRSLFQEKIFLSKKLFNSKII